MIIVPGSASARAPRRPRDDAAARLRGAAAGSISGALAIAAHGWAAGDMPLQSHTLLLLVAACTVVGALVTGVGPLRTTRIGLIAALIGGQLLGHAVMSVDMAAMPGHSCRWTPAMLGAHIVGALTAAIVIRGAEAAYRTLAAALSRILPVLLRPPAVPAPLPLRITHRDSIIRRILAADTGHTRGPPARAIA